MKSNHLWLRISYFILFLGLAGCKSSPKTLPVTTLYPFTPPAVAEEKLLVSSNGIKPDQVGFTLYDPETGKVVSSYNANQTFIPSSVTKIISTLAALQILGPQFKFKTDLILDGKVTGPTARGDLYLRGTGDPFLTMAHLMDLVHGLRKHGIKKFEGRFFYDESSMPAMSSISQQGDVTASYNSGISALSSEFNQLSFRWRPHATESGEQSESSTSAREAYFIPSLPFPSVQLPKSESESDSWKNESDQMTFRYQDSGNGEWMISPYLSPSGKESLPVKNPGYFTASLLRHLAQINGISLPEPKSGVVPKKKVNTLESLPSLPLVELSGKILEFSNNLMTELIHLRAAQKLTGRKMTLSEASQVIQVWVQRKITGASWEGFNLENGSGLGSGTRVSSTQLAKILEFGEHSTLGERTFVSLLPIAGWTGTLSHRMGDPEAALRVWAKTGSQTYTNALAGYVFTQSGKKLIFVILATDFEGRSQYDQFRDKRIPGAFQQKARQWTNRIQSLQEQLLRRWIRNH